MNKPIQTQIPQSRAISSDLKVVLREKGDVDAFYKSRGLNAIAEVRRRSKRNG